MGRSSEASFIRLAWRLAQLALILVGLWAIWYGSTVILGTPSPFYVVSSGSMAPQLNIGDIIVVQDGTTFNTLKVNDTIVFHHPAIPSKVVVHRVYEILEEDGQRKIVTKGLRNPLPDPWKVTEREYVGKVIFTIPKLGYLNTLIQPPLNFTLVAFFIIIIILLEVYSTSEEE